MQVNTISDKQKNIIQNNIKLLSLSSIVFILSTPAVYAQTITQPVNINGGSQSFDGEHLNINATGVPAIQVKNGTLSITNSDFILHSDKEALKVSGSSNVTIIGASGKNATLTSSAVNGNTVNLLNTANLTLDGVTIHGVGSGASGKGATALVAHGNYNSMSAELTLLNSEIIATNVRAISARDVTLKADNFKIVTGKDADASKTHLYGLHAENKNFINLSNGSIETWTNYSNGLNVVMDYDDSTIERLTVNNVKIITHGGNAVGSENINTRTSITGSDILTHGTGGHGVAASNGGVASWAPSHVTVKDTNISTNGRQAYGFVATTLSKIYGRGVTINTTGESGVGVYSQGSGRINVSDNSSITTSGKGAHAAAVMLGSEINISDSDITTSGAGAAGLYMAGYNYTDRGLPTPTTPIIITRKPLSNIDDHNDDPNQYPSTEESLAIDENNERAGISHSNTASLTNVNMNVANGAALHIKGSESNKVTIKGSTINGDASASASFLTTEIYNDVHKVGDVLLDVSSSQLFGNANVQSGSVNLNLSDKSSWVGATEITSGEELNLKLDKTSAWLITANSTINHLENKGAVGFFPSKSNFKTLTLTQADYSTSGGLFTVNTVLGDDSSKTDKIIFEGSVSGNNHLAVHNVGGLGAETDRGIKVITVGAPSSGSFSLISRYKHKGEYAAVAGAYRYKLYQGYEGEPSNQNWYLRSDMDYDDEDGDGDGGFQPGVPVYEAYPQFLLGLNNLPTLQQRTGNRYWSHAGSNQIAQGADIAETYAPAQESGSLTQNNGIWGRIEGAHSKIKPNFSQSRANYDYNSYKVQAGIDGLFHESEQGKLIGGLTLNYTHGLASIWSRNDDDLGRGRIKSDGYGFGGTLTWYDDNGFYADNQAQLTWYRSDLSYQGDKESLHDGKNNGFGFALSSEIGKRFAIDDHWSLTPQAQLQYSHVDFSSFTDVFEAEISREKAASLQARLGLSLDYQNAWQNAQGTTNRSSVYAIANLYNEFLNGTEVDVSTVRFANKSERLWGGIGFGGSYNWNDDQYSVYGEGSLNSSLRHFGDSYSYKGTLGFRVKW
ncbi:autotransporter outer membrane beta-barrel domain-containing protein [Paenochrobactrum glaciei]|uniref:Autotransporter outer membrane beta-barrel domain-containing protein n=1 Tax=Paenochrobactrum glaciei TaxID=486407 RepID=A0ABN1GLN4_9HYPH